jgi:hypothetical protein
MMEDAFSDEATLRVHAIAKLQQRQPHSVSAALVRFTKLSALTGLSLGLPSS